MWKPTEIQCASCLNNKYRVFLADGTWGLNVFQTKIQDFIYYLEKTKFTLQNVGCLDFFLVDYTLELTNQWSLQQSAKNSSHPKEKSRLLNECFKHNLQHCVFKSRIVTRKRLCQKQNRAVIIFIKAQMNRKFYFLSCEEEVVTMLTRFCFIPISNRVATYIYDKGFPLFGNHFLMWTKNHDIIVV